MNTAKIAKLCNEIEDIACDISQQTMNDIISSESRMIFDKAKEITAEITAQPKSNADRIRQMTDKELATFMVIQAIMGALSVNGIQDKAAADKMVTEILIEHKADEDISAALIRLKQEVIEDAAD